MTKILITGDFSVDGRFFPEGYDVIHLSSPKDEHEIANLLPTVEHYILGGPEYLSPYLLDRAVKLKNLVVMGTGTSSFVDVSYAKKMGIRIANTPHLNSRAVVEFTLAMVVNCLAGVFQSIHGVKTGTQWIQTPRLSLSDCRVGILGMGAIGTELASRFFRAGTRSLSYYSRTRKLSLESRWGLRYRPLSELVKEVDILCLHATYTPETHHLLNHAVLATASDRLKVVNVSHPQIICPQALGIFLRARPDAMCFLDGYYREWNGNRGRSDDPFRLLELPNFVATSHIAAQENGAVSAIYERAATILNEFLTEGQSGTHSCISSS